MRPHLADLEPLAVAQDVALQRPVLLSFWLVGLLIAGFAGGLPVDAASEEASPACVEGWARPWIRAFVHFGVHFLLKVASTAVVSKVQHYAAAVGAHRQPGIRSTSRSRTAATRHRRLSLAFQQSL